MEVYLIRHTTPDIKKGICYGQSDIGLAESFEEEKAKVLTEVGTCEDRLPIYSSPLKRCHELANALGTSVQIDDRLKELDFGNWELQAWDTIDPTELSPWMEDFVNVKVPGGESYVELSDRILGFFEYLVKSNYNINRNKVFVVTHAGVIRSFLSYVLEVELKDSFSIQVAYGTVIKLAYGNGVWKVITKIDRV